MSPARAVDFTVSNIGNGSQIWFEAEDFDLRLPDDDNVFAISDAPEDEEAFSKNGDTIELGLGEIKHDKSC